jgi:phosphate transport system substrate-binding protein
VLIAVLAVAAGTQALLAPSAGAAGFVPVAGSGSTWSSNALDQWRRNVANQEGLTVNYSPDGSTAGRNDFRTGQVDFAVSEIPYGLTDGGVLDPNPSRAFGYLPLVAGGTAFMYNLHIGGKQVTNLRLSGDTITKIFTQVITDWSDPQIQADNPGLALPKLPIVPVVYSNSSGPSAQFTAWMASQYPAQWDAYCHRNGISLAPCGSTSSYPLGPGMVAKPQSQGVAGFVAQDAGEGAITYVEYSYARNAGFPVAKVLNKANYYVEPTAGNVAVALLQAQLRPDLTADLSQVYVNSDPRTYPLSNYSYMIIPKDTTGNFSTDKGRTLSEFAAYSLCDGQQQADTLGYTPLPINLVQAGVDQINQIPGSTHKLDRNNLAGCHNPTISPDGGNLVAKNAPQPQPCDLQGAPTPCPGGTGGPPLPSPTIGLEVTPASPVTVGTTETLTTTVPPPAAGSVQFKDGDATIGSAVSVSSNRDATITTTLPSGTHSLTAVFTPTDPTTYGPSPAQLYVVDAPTPPRATTTTLTTSPTGPADPGTSVTLNAAVSPTAAGSVQFHDGNNTINTPATVTNGTASTTTSSLAVGSHQLTAVFTPTDPAAFESSTSPAVTFMVNAPTGAATTTTLTVFPNPAFEGLPVIFLANVAPFGAAGTVQFMDGTTAVDPPVPVAGGFALSITTLPEGTHSLTAVFTPTDPAALAPSTSPSVSLTVQSLFSGLGF